MSHESIERKDSSPMARERRFRREAHSREMWRGEFDKVDDVEYLEFLLKNHDLRNFYKGDLPDSQDEIDKIRKNVYERQIANLKRDITFSQEEGGRGPIYKEFLETKLRNLENEYQIFMEQEFGKNKFRSGELSEAYKKPKK